MNRVTARITYGSLVPYDEQSQWQRDANGWTVELRYQGRRMTVPYWTGVGISGDPTAAMVLESLTMDALSDLYSFEEWAEGYGFDPDSRSAERAYNACKKNAEDLSRLLGDDFSRFTMTSPDEWSTNDSGDVFTPERVR